MKALRRLPPALVLVLVQACATDPDGGAAGTDGSSETAASETDGSESASDDESGSTAEPGTWTVFVYGHADHNLSPSLVADMLEMSQATLTDDVTVIVMADWDGSLAGYASGTEWYRIAGAGAEPELTDSAPEQNLDDPAVLQGSIERAFAENPAANYGLVMWDHGGAWEGGFGGDSADGSGHGSGIAAADLATSIGAALDHTGLERLDFLAFDTCLMAGVEIIAELAPLADLYVANAEIDYGAGWDYAATLSWLAANPEADARSLGLAESEHWNAHHEANGAEDALLRSHVALDTSAAPAFIEAFAAFTDRFVTSSEMSGIDVGRSAYFDLPGYLAYDIGSLTSSPNLRDVGQFLAAMAQSEDAELAGAASAAYDALWSMVVATVNGDLRSPVGQVGVHMELPPARAVPDRLDAYGVLARAWVDATGWDAGLDRMLDLSDGEAPIVFTDAETEPGSLLFATDDVDVAEADITVAAFDPVDPDLVHILGLIGTGVIDAGFEYEFAWDGSLLHLGTEAADAQPVPVFPFARVGIADGDGTPVLAIPGVLRADGEEYEAALPFQATDASVDAVVISTDIETTSVLPLSYVAGVEFIPLVPALRLDTGELELYEGWPIVIPADGVLPLFDGPATAGDYMFVTSVFDVWGNAEPVAALVTLP